MYWSGLLIVVFGDLAPVNIEISSYGENFRAVHLQYLSPIMLFWKKAQQYTLFLFLLLQIKTLKEMFVTLNLQNFLLKIIPVYSIINLLWELHPLMKCHAEMVSAMLLLWIILCTLLLFALSNTEPLWHWFIQVKLSFLGKRVLYMTAFGTLNL